MKRFLLAIVFIFCLCPILTLQGCESEQSRLEKERTKLEIEKLKQEAAQQKASEEDNRHAFNTDKLKEYIKNHKSQADPF
ncbi:MAG: hypothetical protein AB7D37_15115 [Desulfovibrio sp.]